MMPFVSFCISSYNQKDYFLEALEGALAQDYPNMEVIVADDCSTDGSQAAIRARVERYRAERGAHPVVLKFNEQNLGIIKNREGLYALAKGRLIVNADGDDVSFPNRVSRVVEEWEKAGSKHTVICHGYIRMTDTGKDMGPAKPFPAETPLGAVIAYDRRVLTEFPEVSVLGPIDDHVFAKRALMLGEALYFDEPLVRYRTGRGISTGSKMRIRRARIATFNFHAAEQSVIDLEYVRNALPADRYAKAKQLVDKQYAEYHGSMLLTSGSTIFERWRGLEELKQIGFFSGRSRGFCLYASFYLPPKWLCDILLCIYGRLVLHGK